MVLLIMLMILLVMLVMNLTGIVVTDFFCFLGLVLCSSSILIPSTAQTDLASWSRASCAVVMRTLQVELQLFGEVHFVERTAWSPFFLTLGLQISRDV